MSRKYKIARAVHANRGVAAKYKKALASLVEEMARSVEYWLAAAMRKTPPRVAALVEAAQDAKSPAKVIQAAMNELAERWQRQFDEAAPKLAQVFAESMFGATDTAFRAALKSAGWTVQFQMTPAMRDALNATIEGNVGLIKSIPQQYLTEVQGIVMRGYSAGRDLQSITEQLRDRYSVSKRRAELIARDQSNKASAVVNKARSLELGITEALWFHSHGGKEPRPDHVAAHGKKFNLAEGYPMREGYVQPGELIGCRCSYRPILPF